MKLDCSAITDQCMCFAANMGSSCVYCSALEGCMGRDEYASKCSVANFQLLKATASNCGMSTANDIAPELGLNSSLVSKWRLGDGYPLTGSLNIGFKSMYPIQLISVENQGGAVGFQSLPYYQNNSFIGSYCSKKKCSWILKTPRSELVTLDSELGSTTYLQNLQIFLGTFSPQDGYILYGNDWTECSNTCGNGEQYRVGYCNPPKYGGLPCAAGMVISNESRNCFSARDCGADWRICLLIGWWQIVLILIFLTRKVVAWCREREEQKRALAKELSSRYGFDYDDDMSLETQLHDGSLYHDAGEDTQVTEELTLP